MTDAFHLKIISPAAMVLDAHAVMVEIPGAEGDFGVLPNHAPFFSMLRPGVISIHMPDGHKRRFFATAGYADVAAEGTTILSDHIQDLAEITVDDAGGALRAAQSALASAENDVERAAAEKLLASAEALTAAVSAH
jgi:F-type H+-transporting ATPase subunit epsilon